MYAAEDFTFDGLTEQVPPPQTTAEEVIALVELP